MPNGHPIVDTSNPDFPDTHYYEVNGLACMTADLHGAFDARAQSNPGFTGVIPVGDAFQRAVDEGIAKGDGYCGADGTYATAVPRDKVNRWWVDYLHASKHGSYLSAVEMFAKLTGVDPWSFGANEKAVADLGISPGDAVKLQRVASHQLYAAGVPLVRTPCLHVNPRSRGAAPRSQLAGV